MPTSFDYNDIVAQYSPAEMLGEGGQKVVFSIQHPEHGSCVLKIGVYKNRSSLERIRREVEILRQITSPYYPRQFGFEVVDNQRFYVLEERIEGQPLSNAMQRFATVESATRLVLELVEGLSVIWQSRITHRDVKPDNILITPSGRPRIIDLGIARIKDGSSLTHSLAPHGPCTPNYAAPEQLENRKHEINHRADQFCLGIVYAQLLLEGSHPFDPQTVGAGDSIVDNILEGRWARQLFNFGVLSTTLPPLSTMLEREPYQRYRKPERLRSALDGVLAGGGYG